MRCRASHLELHRQLWRPNSSLGRCRGGLSSRSGRGTCCALTCLVGNTALSRQVGQELRLELERAPHTAVLAVGENPPGLSTLELTEGCGALLRTRVDGKGGSGKD